MYTYNAFEVILSGEDLSRISCLLKPDNYEDNESPTEPLSNFDLPPSPLFSSPLDPITSHNLTGLIATRAMLAGQHPLFDTPLSTTWAFHARYVKYSGKDQNSKEVLSKTRYLYNYRALKDMIYVISRSPSE